MHWIEQLANYLVELSGCRYEDAVSFIVDSLKEWAPCWRQPVDYWIPPWQQLRNDPTAMLEQLKGEYMQQFYGKQDDAC